MMRFLSLVLTGLVALAAAEQTTVATTVPAKVPKPVAETLTAAQEATTAEATLAALDAHRGEGHALLDLVRGQTLLRLGADDPAQLGAAEAAFTAALARDAGLRQAHLGLAQTAALRADWPAALIACGAAIDLTTATADELNFYASAAWQARDWRLVNVLLAHGIARFPTHDGFRRLELAALVHGGRADEARQAVLALLDRHPDDAELWRHLAWSAQTSGDETQALAALEMAVLTAPDDAALRQRLAAVQLGRGMPAAALATLRPLLVDPAAAEPALLMLAVRAAADGDARDQARAWLAAVPEARRTRDQRLVAARLAVQDGDHAAALIAVTALVELGENDAQVLAWAGQVSEQAADDARAEAFYSQAAATEHPIAAAATLRLVALYLRQERLDDASALLALHLAKHPDDAQARTLQQRLASRSP